MIFYIIIGLPTNLMILTLFPFKNKSSTISNFYIRILAMSDLMALFFVIPLTIVKESEQIMDNGLCKLTGAVYNSFSTYGTLITMLIAVERWFAIYKPYTIKKKHLYVLMLLILIFAIPVAIDPIINFEIRLIHFQNSTDIRIKCNSKSLDNSKSSNYIVIGGLGFLGIIVFILYTSIFIAILKRIKIEKFQNTIRQSNSYSKQLKIIIMLFGITIIFYLSWAPTIFAMHNIKIPLIIHYFHFINNSTNFFIYLIFHPGFRENLLNWFKKKTSIVRSYGT